MRRQKEEAEKLEQNKRKAQEELCKQREEERTAKEKETLKKQQEELRKQNYIKVIHLNEKEELDSIRKSKFHNYVTKLWHIFLAGKLPIEFANYTIADTLISVGIILGPIVLFVIGGLLNIFDNIIYLLLFFLSIILSVNFSLRFIQLGLADLRYKIIKYRKYRRFH